MQHSPIFADISSFQPHFDPIAYRDAGHMIVAIKATEGVVFVDPRHRGHALAAGLHHIGVVHYHFARPDLGDGPIAEAQHFLTWALPLAGPRDYLVVDVERATPAGWSHDPQWTFEFDRYVCEHSRFATILYASRSTLQIPGDWLFNGRKRVWDAAYGTEPDFAPAGYTCVFRQFTDGVVGPEPHTVAGVGRCDVNRMSRQMFATIAAEAPSRGW